MHLIIMLYINSFYDFFALIWIQEFHFFVVLFWIQHFLRLNTLEGFRNKWFIHCLTKLGTCQKLINIDLSHFLYFFRFYIRVRVGLSGKIFELKIFIWQLKKVQHRLMKFKYEFENTMRANKLFNINNILRQKHVLIAHLNIIGFRLKQNKVFT